MVCEAIRSIVIKEDVADEISNSASYIEKAIWKWAEKTANNLDIEGGADPYVEVNPYETGYEVYVSFGEEGSPNYIELNVSVDSETAEYDEHAGYNNGRLTPDQVEGLDVSGTIDSIIEELEAQLYEA